MTNKKAQSKLMVTLVAFLAAALVAVLIFSVVLPALQEISGKNLCKATVVEKYGVGRTSELGGEARTRLACYTQTLKITRDGIFKSGKNREPRRVEKPNYDKDEKDDGIRLKAARTAIANEMYDCWDQFYEGTLPIFFGREKRCIICSDIIFEDGWRDERSQEKFIIGEFLNDEEHPEAGMAYADYFGGRFQSEFAVDPSQKTQIIFRGVGRAWFDNWWVLGATIVGCLTPVGCLVGGAIGVLIAVKEGEDWTSVVLLGPESQIGGKECGRLF